MDEQLIIDNVEMKLSESSKNFLKETAKWTYLLTIVGFIIILLILASGLFAFKVSYTMIQMNSEMYKVGASFGLLMALLKIATSVLYIYPVYCLNKFSSQIKEALLANDSEMLATALEFLKSHYKYLGIMTIAIAIFYIFLFVSKFFL